MNEAIAVFRRKGLPIVFVYREDGKDGKDVGYRVHTWMNHKDCWNTHHHGATAYTVGVPMAIHSGA